MNEERDSYRIQKKEIVVKSENSLYPGEGVGGGDNVKSALDNIKSRVANLEQQGGGGGSETIVTVSGGITPNMVHFSFDDAVVALRNITQNASTYTSIFQCAEFARLKKWHDDYGAVFSMYVFLQQLNPNDTSVVWFDLSNITDKFADEFTANADWLRFGLHCRNNIVNYGSGDGIDAAGVTSDYNTFVTQIVRITGSVKCIDMVPRLHNYAGTLANVQAMRNCECGIIGLLGSDDTTGGLGTGGYYLGSGTAAQALLRNKGIYYDPTEQLYFFPTNTRLESVTSANIQSFIEGFGEATKYNRGHDVILFTHEASFSANGNSVDSTMEAKIETCLKWAYDNGFSFGFPMDKIRGLGAINYGSPSDTSKKSIKILTIGNSFCENLFLYYQYNLLGNLGISNVTIYNLFRGGMSPAGWWTAWDDTNTKGSVEYYCGPHITAMDSFAGSAATAYDAVSATDWDVIILQQFHTNAPSYASLLPNIAHLVAHIRQACPNRKVRVGMNMEWPRSIDSLANNGPKGILGYEAIVEEIKAAYDGGNLDFIVPNGTAIMNAAYNSTLNTLMPSGSSYASDRTAEAGGTSHTANPLLLSQRTASYGNDRLHLANGVGKYVIAGCFFEAVIRPLLGKSIVDSTYTASADSGDTGSIAVTAENRGLCHAAALYAVANPFTRSELNSKNF